MSCAKSFLAAAVPFSEQSLTAVLGSDSGLGSRLHMDLHGDLTINQALRSVGPRTSSGVEGDVERIQAWCSVDKSGERGIPDWRLKRRTSNVQDRA